MNIVLLCKKGHIGASSRRVLIVLVQFCYPDLNKTIYTLKMNMSNGLELKLNTLICSVKMDRVFDQREALTFKPKQIKCNFVLSSYNELSN